MDFLERIERRTLASAKLRWSRYWWSRTGLDNALASERNPLPAQTYDLWFLYSTVRRMRPKIILEFGIGYSTLAMAHALRRNRGGVIYSVEANDGWLSHFTQRAPADLAAFIKPVHSRLEITDCEGEACHRYADVPDIVPDLIYLDGPDPRDVPGWASAHAVAVDPIGIVTRMPKGSRIIVDTRYENCRFLDRHWSLPRTDDKIFKTVVYDVI